MAQDRFEVCLQRVLKHEGGYVNHPRDPGGETNFGITRATATAHGYTGEMRSIPMDTVHSIYRHGFWNAVRADELPWGLDYIVFDAAVNHGPRTAVMQLQNAVRATVDGVIGPRTVAAAQGVDPHAAIREVAARRAHLYGRLPTFSDFGLGWSRRLADVLFDAARDAA